MKMTLLDLAAILACNSAALVAFCSCSWSDICVSFNFCSFSSDCLIKAGATPDLTEKFKKFKKCLKKCYLNLNIRDVVEIT